jgi:hypothetical protein
MKRHLLLTLSLFASAALHLSSPAFAAEGVEAMEKKAEQAEVAEKTGKPFPYTGKVTKVDAAGNSFSLNGAKGKERVFMVNEATKITKDGQPSTLNDLAVGDAVTGSVSKQGETQIAKSLKMGAKAEAKAKAPEPTVNPAATPTPETKAAAADAAKATPTPKKAMKK